MKFFTRELYERGRSAVDAIVDAAEEEWELANKRYQDHLHAIEADLPAHLRAFNELMLHDALVQLIARQGSRLVVIVRTDVPPRDLVILDYDLEDEPLLEPLIADARDWSGPTQFNFDEFDVVHQPGGVVYTQEIAFNNGWLLRLRFHDVRVTLASPLYLAPQLGPALVGGPFLQAG